ncbi:hypothetical protein [uncultured Arthrobacter sp.]|uniref:hypothetical protein n=1 Tax=uncultured Arthrobacter sp. TaxID=114050 RepID=UPI0028D5E25E|nr:hypothetical protein [uncultured Arthrobacter sp.]
MTAVCSAEKAGQVRAEGADRTIDRGTDLVSELGRNSFDVVIDMVGGGQAGQLLELLRRAAGTPSPVRFLALWPISTCAPSTSRT